MDSVQLLKIRAHQVMDLVGLLNDVLLRVRIGNLDGQLNQRRNEWLRLAPRLDPHVQGPLPRPNPDGSLHDNRLDFLWI